MTLFVDARIPVVNGTAESAASDDVVLLEGRDFVFSPSGHPVGCACCVARGPVAEAFSRLLLARVRGEISFFRRVLAVTCTAEGREAVLGALAKDPVVSARFRLEE